MDELSAVYNGNQLKSVEDASDMVSHHESGDFKDFSTETTEYTYNANGALTRDLNKGVSSISYNSLNLPRQIDIKSPFAEARNSYLYSAEGVKLRVTQRWNPNYSTLPVIGTDVNESTLTQVKTTDHVGNMVYENGTLKRILTENGYIEGGLYHFYRKDHQGNVRTVAREDGAVVQETDYYPFGLPYADSGNPDRQPYKYNGKEYDRMHGLNWYDYSARYYDPVFPVFTTIDPLAERYYSWSPYVYCSNNPVNRIDPDGKADFWVNGRVIGNDGTQSCRTCNSCRNGFSIGILIDRSSHRGSHGNLGHRLQDGTGQLSLLLFVNINDIIDRDESISNQFLPGIGQHGQSPLGHTSLCHIHFRSIIIAPISH